MLKRICLALTVVFGGNFLSILVVLLLLTESPSVGAVKVDTIKYDYFIVFLLQLVL